LPGDYNTGVSRKSAGVSGETHKEKRQNSGWHGLPDSGWRTKG